MMTTRSNSIASKTSINDVRLPSSDSNTKYRKRFENTSNTTEWKINYVKDANGLKYKLVKNKERETINVDAIDSESKSKEYCVTSSFLSDSRCTVLEEDYLSKMHSKEKENTEVSFELSVLASSTFLSQEETASFIKENIKQRECTQFIPKGERCQCGKSEANHSKDVNKSNSSGIWSVNQCTKQVPCDCFGQIQFRGFGSCMTTPLYARVDSESDCNDIWKLMIQNWKMPKPRLLISVTGGAQRFELKPRLSSILKQGLIEAAINTGAWIITGGTKSGVMEFVGEAVKDYMTIKGSSAEEECIAIGVATWGIVGNKEALENGKDSGLWPADYESEKLTPKSTALDPNHTHFFLVDDGTEGNFGREIPFRSRLEKFVSDLNPPGVSEDQQIKIPVVLIVVEGGIGTIDTVKESLTHETPVVIIKGSGRAADYLATCYEAACKNSEAQFVTEADVKKVFDLKDDEKIKKCISSVKDCLKPQNLIYLNIFDLEKSTSFKDIDREILYALLRANKSDCKSQLNLALAWRRCDVAEQQIFTNENRSSWKPEILNNAMFTALVQDQTDFVQLLLGNGVDIRKFLTIETLWNLYYNCIHLQSLEASILKEFINVKKLNWLSNYACCWNLQSRDFSHLLQKVNDAVTNLLQDQSFIFYKGEKFVKQGEIPKKPKMEWLPKSNLSKESNDTELSSVYQNETRKKEEDYDFEFPARDLFIFAVLFNRQDLAKFFLKIGSDHIAMSLLGSSILKALSQKADNDEETALSIDLLNHSRFLEMFAKTTLNECYLRSKLDAHTLLYREMKQFGNISVLFLVDRQDLMDFAEHPAFQTKLTSLWKGDVSPKTSAVKIFLTCLCPLLIFTIKFLDQRRIALPSSNKISDMSCIPRVKDNDKILTKYIVNTEVKVGFSHNRISIFKGLHKFYSAPVIKFTNNIVSYIVLLGLFSYFLLTDMFPVSESESPSVIEYIVWAWFATLLLEEIRQIAVVHQSSWLYKISGWWNNTWNRFDLLMYTLMCVSIILRYQLTGKDFVYARIVYSITLVMSYLRFMQFYFAEQNMGPKVIMIKRMLTDLTFFFFILIIFVLAFGIAYHINMFPNQPKDWSILYTVFLYPYFQIYGELFLDDLKGKSNGDGCTTDPSIWELDPTQRCPEQNAIVYIFLSVYLVLINILLINLLIAMFRGGQTTACWPHAALWMYMLRSYVYTFQKVQDNSTQVWRFHRISLVYEYFDRPSLPPPLIIINHLWRLVFFCCPCLRSGRHGKFGEELTDDANNRLRLFEKAAFDTCLTQAAAKEKELLENQVALTVSKMDFLIEELNKIKETLQKGVK